MLNTESWDDDFLADLAAAPVPPVPVNFQHRLRDGMNRAIATEQLGDVVLGGLPWAALEFLQAICGTAALSLGNDLRRR